MIRVCGVIGTWQLITLVASLGQNRADNKSGKAETHDDYLIVYETGGVTGEFKAILQQMALAAHPWKKIIWAYDLLTDERKFSPRRYRALLQTLRARVGIAPESVGEIWTCWLTRPAEKLLFGAFPRARIVLYEDGLISYIPVPVSPRLLAPPETGLGPPAFWAQKGVSRVLPSWRFRRSQDKLDPAHLGRVDRAYLLLSDKEPLPETLQSVSRCSVDYAHIRTVLARVAAAVPSEMTRAAPPGQGNQVLVLGQALSRNRIMSRADELGFYQSVVQTVLAKGYTILWKEHPRISEPFFKELETFAASLGASGRVLRLDLPHAFPVELVAEGLRLAACVGGTTAALFYLRHLYGISCYTFAEDLRPRMQGVDVFMNDMVRREAAPLRDLPDVNGQKI